MPYRPHGKAEVNPYYPRAFAICNRCGALYNSFKLNWQFQWMGDKLQNKWVQVCETCMDDPSIFLRQIILPPDPPSIYQPRPEPYAIDEAGGQAMPIYLIGPAAAAPILVPSWAKAFLAASIGSGGGGGVLNGSYPNMGGGGGAWAQTNRVPVAGGSTIYYTNGGGGAPGVIGPDSWVSTTALAPASTAQGVMAKGGGIMYFPGSSAFGGLGGQASACIGDLAYSGGNGGTSVTHFSGGNGGTGGGGAAGPHGPGTSAVDYNNSVNGTAGGGSDGALGAGTGGQPGQGQSAPGQPGAEAISYPDGGGAGGGGGGGGGGAGNFGGSGGAGGGFGGGGGGGGYAAIQNGLGGPGAPGFSVLRWLQ